MLYRRMSVSRKAIFVQLFPKVTLWVFIQLNIMDANNIKTELDELLAKLSDPEFLSSAQGEAKKAGARLQKLRRTPKPPELKSRSSKTKMSALPRPPI